MCVHTCLSPGQGCFWSARPLVQRGIFSVNRRVRLPNELEELQHLSCDLQPEQLVGEQGRRGNPGSETAPSPGNCPGPQRCHDWLNLGSYSGSM